MKDERRNYVIAGGFVVAMVVGLVLWLALISGRTGSVDSYWVRYRNVMGLNDGTKVLFEGYPVGAVDRISPLPASEGGGFRVDVNLTASWPVPDDSVAAVTAGGLLAAVVVNIRGGDSKQLLAPGSEIPGSEKGSLIEAFSSVADQVKGIADDVKPVLDSLSERVPEIMDEAHDLVSQLNALAERLDGIFSDPNVDHIDNIFTNLDETTANTAHLSADLQETQARLDKLLISLDTTIGENREDLRRVAMDLRSSLEQVSDYIPTIVQNLESSMRNLNEFTSVIRQNPGVLIRGRTVGDDPEASP
ncbi:MAG: MlaD family protein [Myxococcota bacterium]